VKLRRVAALLAAASVAAGGIGCGTEGPGTDQEGYEAEIARYRAERETRLRAEDGWLSLAGLFWLERGVNRIGSNPVCEVRLPADAAPPAVGELLYDGTRARLVPRPEAALLVNGERTEERTLLDDAEGEPDVVELGRLRFYVIRRGERSAVRVKDPENEARRAFRGLDFFPVDPAYRVVGRLRRFETPRPVTVPTVVGTAVEMLAPGRVEFSLGGRDLSLLPLMEEPGETELFVIFRDGTSGDESYGAGRFLSARLDGERVTLDFNKAYNPPCAFTPFATCPLPPPENRFAVKIRAGEKAYHRP
jgi:uncharacterized protein (DUF1684 family)